MSVRYDHIDVARGISIILVVANHSAFRSVAPDFFAATSSIRLPLFFFLSGVLFSVQAPLGSFVLRRADALLKPYFFTLGMCWLVSWLLLLELPFSLSGILYGSGMTIAIMPLWFLPHLFLLHCSAYHLVRGRWWLSLNPLSSGLALAGGFMLGVGLVAFLDFTQWQVVNAKTERVGLPFSVDVLPMSLAFFMAGVLLRKQVVRVKANRKAALLCVLLCVLLNLVADPYLDFNGRIIIEPWWVLLSAIMGLYAILNIAALLSQINCMKVGFTRVGQSALFILIFHSVFVGTSYRLLLPSLVSSPVTHGVVIAVLFVLGVVGPLFIRAVVIRVSVLRDCFLPTATLQKHNQRVSGATKTVAVHNNQA